MISNLNNTGELWLDALNYTGDAASSFYISMVTTRLSVSLHRVISQYRLKLTLRSAPKK